MRVHTRWVRVVSVAFLVLLLGGAFPAHPSPVRAAGLWYVSKAGVDTNDCLSPATACGTINGAMDKITAGETILVESGLFTFAFSDEMISVKIVKAVTLSGGWDEEFTAQSGYTTIDGQSIRTGIDIGDAPFDVVIRRFVVQNSKTGIVNRNASLTLEDCVIQNNYDLNSQAGGISSAYSPNLTILNSTIRGNTGSYVGGIGIWSGSTVVIRNSAITGNTSGHIGAVSASTSGDTVIENSTISGNSGDQITGGLAGTLKVFNSTISDNSSHYGGGGAYATITFTNTILAGNHSVNYPDCRGNYVSAGYNLFGDLTGCAVTLQPSDLSNVDPELGPLQGDPAYYPLLPASPAVDAGDLAGCLDHTGTSLDADQRGLPRLGRCDIGAVELQPIEFSTFSVDRNLSHPGETLTYTALLRAGGADTLIGVTLENILPAGITYLTGSLQASAGTAAYLDGKVSWSGDLDPAAPVTLTYKARAGGAGDVINPFVLAHGGETQLRTVEVKITPYFTYLPAVVKPCPAYYSDNFTNPASGWYTGSTNNYLVQYLPGEYQLLMKSTNHFLLVRAPFGPIPYDFQVSVDVRNVTGVDGSYGLMFGATQDWSHFYTFEILPDQTWYLWEYDNGTWRLPANGYSSEIMTGGQSNNLTVRHEFSTFFLLINNRYVYPHLDSRSYDGYVGVTAQSFDAVPLDVRFSNFFMPEFSCIAQVPGLMTARSPAGGAPGGVFQGPAQRRLP